MGTEVSRAFMQYFMTVKVARETQVRKEFGIICRIFEEPGDRHDDWKKMIGLLNRQLQFVQMTIRAVISELNGAVYWGIANTATDELSKLSSYFAGKDLKYVQDLLRAMIEKKGQIEREPAERLKHDDGPDKMTFGEVKLLLSDLVKLRWLKIDKSENFLFGERTYLEFNPYFDQLLKDGNIPECRYCKKWCILGTEDGSHFHCEDREMAMAAEQ
uniref:Non-structural maintenance of chromosomes element 1 homolog n=1 Tax=Spongospora subterranea TaxID=70186 RepID=A0A0H5R7D8_9EUKA|eukprot:CRZ09672.1 hypothetical protein [Spongospora subterranea]